MAVFGVVGLLAGAWADPAGADRTQGEPAAPQGSPAMILATAPPTPPAPAEPADERADDPRVRAFLEAYGSHVDSTAYAEDDVVFTIRDRRIHFQDGRMLDAERLHHADWCDPIFYRYSLEPLTEVLPEEERSVHCTHWQESLWGRTEAEIRTHGRSVRFLDHRLFVNERLVEPLAAVEREVRAAALWDASVHAWIADLDIVYSFIDRQIAGSNLRSQHAWGLALDLVPTSYGRKPVYWRWSRALDRNGWMKIPPSRRWSPPQRVIEIFESHGFVWGGKWTYFDNMHFEYRPEILHYNRLVADPT